MKKSLGLADVLVERASEDDDFRERLRARNF